MRKTLLAALVLGFSVALISPMVSAKDAPVTLTIDSNGKGKKVENFKHAEHGKRAENPPAGIKEKGCKVCHHKEEGKPCKDCHKEKKEGDTPELKEAFHKSCKDGCHKILGKGPSKKCEDCHGKDKK